MPRDSQNTPFTQIQRSQGLESKVQRFLSALETSVIELTEFLTPFKQPQPWLGLAYQSTWADAATGAFRGQCRPGPLNDVLCRGSCSKPALPLANEVMFILPRNLWPKAVVTFTLGAFPYGQTGVLVTTLGEVRWLGGSYTGVSLEQIRYTLEAA